MKLVFDVEEIEVLLSLAEGEVKRYTDMKPFGKEDSVGCSIMKAKWEGKAETFRDMLKYGERIDDKNE